MFVEALLLAVPFTAAMTIPMAVFVTVLWVFTRLGAEGTLAAAQQERDGVRRLVAPVLGAAAFSAAGLYLGTAIQPQQIGLMFGVIVAPMIFFGCAYYPWQGLSAVPAMKYAVLINPLVYVAEGMRGALTPDAPHMSLGVVILALILITGLFWTLGMRSFMKRAVG